jgi:hypothetical protein
VDQCAGGFDLMPTGALVGISTVSDSCDPNLNLVMSGPVAIRRSNPVDISSNFSGVGLLDHHLDVIDTEILSMQLAGGGVTLRAGAGMGIGAQLRPSLGAIHEGPVNSTADSFFDVFFEIEIPGGGFAYNQEPLRVTSEITCVPPDANYLHPVGCVKLFTSPFVGAGQHVANLTSANHSTYPACGDPGTGPCDQPHDTPFCNKDECCTRVCELRPNCCTQAWDESCVAAAEVVCNPGACCLPQRDICDNPGTCANGFPNCNSNPDCLCFDAAEGSGGCSRNFSCAEHLPCPNGSSDCPSGETCYVNTCCNGPICGPSQCVTSSTAAPVDPSAGPTASGGQRVVSGAIPVPTLGCIVTDRIRCDELGGTYEGNGTICTPLTCPRTEACCLPEGQCRDALPDDCRQAGGRPQGPGTTCDGVRCGVVEVDHFPNTTAVMELQLPNGGNVPIALSGPTTVHVFFEGPNEGDANDSNGNGLDEVQTEMVDMQLTGSSPFGPVVVRLNPNIPSRGQIEETANTQPGRLDLPPFAATGTANSFFDVFFEIEVGGVKFHTATPKRMSSVIAHKPPAPGNTYENLEKITLLDENGNPTGFSIGAGRHTPRPPVEIDHFPNTTAVMELQLPNGDSEVIHLAGPTTVHVFFEGPNEGDANDDNGNGLDDVATEMVDMQLTGNSSFGPVLVRLNPAIPSRGQIEETANTQPGRLDLPPFAPTGTANSFFDVFFEIRVGPLVLHTATPKRMSSVITHKPPAPGDTYENPEKIPLLDANGNPTGLSIAAGRHTPNPALPEACCLPNGTCEVTLADRCRQAGGVPRGPNSQCLGDANDNGIDDACEPEHPCESCGGFPHWIDQCPGGFDDMPTGALVGIDLGGDCEADVSAVLNGPAHIVRSPSHDDSLFYPGLRPIDGHRDVIDTEIVAMELTGGGLTLRAGAGFGHGGVLRPSRGAIAEDPADALLGDSFFDVFFEVDLGGGHFAYNWIPVRVEADVTCLPPQVTYIHVLACIPLFPTPFQSPGVRPVAFLAEARHGAYPTCGSDVTGDCFTPHDTPFCNKGDCCHLVCELVPDCCGIAWSQLCASVAHDVCGPSQACCMPNGSCKESPPTLCESASGTPKGEGSTCENTRCPRAGDCRVDGRVDLRDVARFQNCFTGSRGHVGRECHCADLDADGDVDLVDWRIFGDLLTGP